MGMVEDLKAEVTMLRKLLAQTQRVWAAGTCTVSAVSVLGGIKSHIDEVRLVAERIHASALGDSAGALIEHRGNVS
ncbi:hypothetical protein VWY34_15425 [Phaeobacter sp. JH20_02]|uniref:hypothetical protein n=1 Tax=Phaeobacter sp. JH20_02 TaxID=3112461 RepID=UPI003A89EE94